MSKIVYKINGTRNKEILSNIENIIDNGYTKFDKEHANLIIQLDTKNRVNGEKLGNKIYDILILRDDNEKWNLAYINNGFKYSNSIIDSTINALASMLGHYLLSQQADRSEDNLYDRYITNMMNGYFDTKIRAESCKETIDDSRIKLRDSTQITKVMYNSIKVEPEIWVKQLAYLFSYNIAVGYTINKKYDNSLRIVELLVDLENNTDNAIASILIGKFTNETYNRLKLSIDRLIKYLDDREK